MLRLQASTGIVAAAKSNSQLIDFFTPNQASPIVTINCGLIVKDFAFHGATLVAIGQNQLKIFDLAKWTGEIFVGMTKLNIVRMTISQTGLIALFTL